MEKQAKKQLYMSTVRDSVLWWRGTLSTYLLASSQSGQYPNPSLPPTYLSHACILTYHPTYLTPTFYIHTCLLLASIWPAFRPLGPNIHLLYILSVCVCHFFAQPYFAQPYSHLNSFNAIYVTRCWLILIECWIFQCSNVQIFQCSNIPMFNCSNVQMFQCSNLSILKGSA